MADRTGDRNPMGDRKGRPYRRVPPKSDRADQHFAAKRLALCPAGRRKISGGRGGRTSACQSTAGASAYTRWLKSRETLLYQGHADKIADELEKTARKGAVNAEQLNTAAGYFRTNHQRMNYLEMREEEWPIGSGMVESGAKQFKARFCGPGMRWSRQGAENLLPVRAAVLSGRFDQMWDAAKNLPPS
jgi:hypothetical protein